MEERFYDLPNYLLPNLSVSHWANLPTIQYSNILSGLCKFKLDQLDFDFRIQKVTNVTRRCFRYYCGLIWTIFVG